MKELLESADRMLYGPRTRDATGSSAGPSRILPNASSSHRLIEPAASHPRFNLMMKAAGHHPFVSPTLKSATPCQARDTGDKNA